MSKPARITTCPECGSKNILTAEEAGVPRPTAPMPSITGWITVIFGFVFMALGLFAMRDGDLNFGVFSSIIGVVMAVGGFLATEYIKKRTAARDFPTELQEWEESRYCQNCKTKVL
ncbi:MAG: hypothetical protein FWE26_06605 [Coriobacteriia bacterium]|nr:hypothetical protein [Coriobacteriia bacterium]